MSTNDQTKVSDSGYANTYDNSQSRGSGGSSVSRNSNRSGNSGYREGHPANCGYSNEVLPQPISKRREKEPKKTKSKTLTSLENEHGELVQKCSSQQRDTEIYNNLSSNSKQVFKKSGEVGTVELIDAKKPSGRNGKVKSTLPEKDSQANPRNNTSSNTNGGYTLVSLHDGLVLYSTDSFQTSLGYPKDAWLGNSFIDFIHPKDRAAFGDKLSDGYVGGERGKDIAGKQMSLFCRMKKYSVENSGSKSAKDQENGIGALRIEEKGQWAASYAPYHLNLGFKYFPERDSGEEKSRMLFLVIMAQPVLSAYKAPEETLISPIFSTRHTATCCFSHVDDDIVRYFGYLPQDMIGQSVFNHYHPEDLPFLKDVYETVVKLQGSSFRSKPYRFAVQNGGYVVLETEWSSFINPWGRKLECIIGQHKILRGPRNPDIFQQLQKEHYDLLPNLSEEMLKESQIIQDEICTLLTKTIEKPSDCDALLLTKKRSELISFISGIKGSKMSPKLDTSIPVDVKSFSEHDTVMLGEISPHHEYCGSKSSSETPPSYNQLNYNEKIDRFFDSKPRGNAMYGSDEDITDSFSPNHNKTEKMDYNHISMNNTPNHNSGGSGSGENLSSTSNHQTSFESRDDSGDGNVKSTALDSCKLPTLTEGLLHQHNHDMENLMVLKHKERRSSLKKSKMNKNNRMKNADHSAEQDKLAGKTRGTKRASTDHRGDQLIKSSKYDDTQKYEHETRNPTTDNVTNLNQLPTNINMWPQISVIPPLPMIQHHIPPNATSHQAPRCSPFPQMVPVYYLPMSTIRDNTIDTTTVQSSNHFHTPQHIRPNQSNPYTPSPMAGIVYPPIVGAPTPAPIIYAPSMILGVPTVSFGNPQPRLVPSPVHREKTEQSKCLVSPATSVKAEPGSISKKLLSPGDLISSCLSVNGSDSNAVGIRNPVNTAQSSQIESTVEDSSDSSFYGSFLNTSSGSSCNPHPRGFEYALTEETLCMSTDPYRIYGTKDSPQTSLKKASAPWMGRINMTSNQIYQYQLSPEPLKNVLKNDMKILNQFPQPLHVNDQMDQLHLDLELSRFGSKLSLEASGPSGDSNRANGSENRADIATQV